MRVYVPLTLSGLAEAYKTGELGSGPFVAYAVTPALREWYLSDDIEELEYAALNRAALAALRLLAADPGAVRRRVVVAVDVPDGAAVSDPDRGLDPAARGTRIRREQPQRGERGPAERRVLQLLDVVGDVPLTQRGSHRVRGQRTGADFARPVRRCETGEGQGDVHAHGWPLS